MANKYNYISSMVNQYGTDWIVALRPEDIQRNAKRVCRDMVKGSIDYETYGVYFLDSKFLENIIIGINNELEINNLNYSACTFWYNYNPTVPNLAAHIQHLYKLCNIYYTILSKLNSVKETGNIGCLADISGLLFNDRNHLN